MKKKLRFLFYPVVLIAFIVSGLLAFVRFAKPDVGAAPNIKVEATPANIEHGRYLATSVAACMDCHSKRDWSRYAGPPIAETWGMGGEVFDQKAGLPGYYTSKNITPANLKTWTDGELYRAITEGVSKDGSPLFPMMPHPHYGKMATSDIYAIIAYIRTLKPIENKVQASVSDFPMNFIVRLIPQKASPQSIPDKSNKVAYGNYLFNAAACTECHSQMKRGNPIKGLELAGGFKFPLPTGGVVESANITPDKETGIGNWTEEQFVNRFKIYADSTYRSPKVEGGEFNTMMPWVMYGKMTTEDLSAIYAYLKTQKPVKNLVKKFTP